MFKNASKTQKFVFSALGVFVAHFYFGVLQEKITKGTYKTESRLANGEIEVTEEKYTYALSLVFVLCLVNYIFSKVVVVMRNEPEDKTHNLTFYYCGAALCYLLAMVCSNMALQWVNYPTQVVGKSAKPIPVMLLGVLISHKSYPFRKYVFVTLVVVGVVLFMYKDQKVTAKAQEQSFGIGELLLILSLTMDGLLGALQELMRSKAKPSGDQMMVNTNFWSCIYLAAALVLTGEVFEFTAFATRHPIVLFNLVTAALAGAVGQHFIYVMVSDFGPLPVSIVTTTRKFVTVLFSVVFFGNTLSGRQWIGTVLVFTALFLDAIYSKSKPKPASVSSKKLEAK